MSDPSLVFKQYIVRRPHGGCTVEFPLADLDRLVDAACARETKKRSCEGCQHINRGRCAIWLKDTGGTFKAVCECADIKGCGRWTPKEPREEPRR